MDDKLLEMYLQYASTAESVAVLFVKKYLDQAKGHWVDILEYERYEMSEDDLHFRYVICGLYKRNIRPAYPPKSDFMRNAKFDERTYYLHVRAITWETAHRDIAQQKSQERSFEKYKITGVSYDKNRGNMSYFRDDAPLEVKALEKNITDRRNPVWDYASNYINKPEFIYKIKSIERLD
jgi:hypothetical protein